MKIIAICQKLLKELFRDKRTLALMFLAPIFVLFLMNVMFSAEMKVNVKIATYAIPTSLERDLEKVDHLKVTRQSDATSIQKLLHQHKVDATLSYSSKGYELNHANTDSSKTSFTKQVVKTALAKAKNQALLIKLKPLMGGYKQKKPEKQISLTESYQYGDQNTTFFAKMIPVLIGFVTFFFVFLISGMALLKERSSGTLDRLLATPVRRFEIVLGYTISFGFLALLQTLIIVMSSIYFLKLEVVGNLFLLIFVSNLLALVALAFGILLSTLAKSEFQMMQFIPLVVLPQLFFSGIIPIDSMAKWVQNLGYILPLSYSGHAMSGIVLEGMSFAEMMPDILALLIFLVILTIANILGLRRYRKV